jgi:putative transcriptional regulator
MADSGLSPSYATSAQEIRKRLGLSQSAFAAMMGVSLRTLQEWEQGRHQPSGPALALLRIADQEPDVFLRIRLE